MNERKGAGDHLPLSFSNRKQRFRLQSAEYRGKHEKKEAVMGIAGFIAALAGSVLSLIISFIPVQFTNILLALFLVFLTVMCRMMPHRASIKGCLIGCAILTLVFRFMYMTTIGIILYGICMIAVIAGAVLMNIAGNSHATVGGEKA